MKALLGLLALYLLGQEKKPAPPPGPAPAPPGPAPAPPGPAPAEPVPPPFPGPAPIPEAPTPPPALPAAGGTYTIRSGDTPSGLAQRATGNPDRWRELLPLNPELRVVHTRKKRERLPSESHDRRQRMQGADEGEIVATHVKPFNPGQVLRIPADWSLPETPAAPIEEGRTYTIRTGDTPSGLAQRATGNAGRWRELLLPNPGLKVVHTKNKKGEITATHIKPFNPGQVLRLPSDWSSI